MLDIIILFVVTRNLGARLRAKGHRPFWYQFLLVFVWIVGEVVGIVAGMFVASTNFGGIDQNRLLIMLFGLLGAGFATVIVFAIVNQLPDLRSQMAGYKEQDYYRREVDRGPTPEDGYRTHIPK